MIPFNKPYLTGSEIPYINEAVSTGKLSGNGIFTQKCQLFFHDNYGFGKCLLTSSCTDALEMAALLLDIKFGDEIIMPSYTFVSTANAFVLRGANIIFADSMAQNPNIDAETIESLITVRTKAIVPVHYAGFACDMEKIMEIAYKYNLYVVEDAAQAINNYYTYSDGSKRALGSIGHLAAFSFHETKNIISGEGGMLVINDDKFVQRAEIIWEKGTNRSAFFRGESNKYGWVDIGSSFLPSEITAAFLWAQLENIKIIQDMRIKHWNQYWSNLKDWALLNNIKMPDMPVYSSNNAHMFYLICKNNEQRAQIINHLKKYDILAVFHYLSLHKSQFYDQKHDGRDLVNADNFTDNLLRLPLYFELDPQLVIKKLLLFKS